MNQCSKCGNRSYSAIVIFTETTFGHGDSSHKTYVKCTHKNIDGVECGNRTEDVWGRDLFADADLRKAQALWNAQNP